MEDRQPIRVTEEIRRLREQNRLLEGRVTELEQNLCRLERLEETVDQFQAVLECGAIPAPIFLRWTFGQLEGCPAAKATFGKYSLECVDGHSAVSWYILVGEKCVDAGGGHTRFDYGLDECEQALRRIVQAKSAAPEGEG